jgi:retron-type reverse transcriptase
MRRWTGSPDPVEVGGSRPSGRCVSTKPTLYQRLHRRSALYSAWGRVVRGTQMPGADGIGLRRFERDLDDHIDRLRSALADRTYRPGPLRTFERESRTQVRLFAVPTVRDRIAQRAALDVLAGRLGRAEHADSFAYRKGSGWLDALRRVGSHRDHGLRWVYRFDVERFFESIPHAELRNALEATLVSPPVVELLMAWVAAPVVTCDGLAQPSAGVPMGTPIAAALANHFLTPLDKGLDGPESKVVRYADDVVVACADHETAIRAQVRAEGLLADLGLRANPSKSYLSTFERGFGFLGWVFHGNGGWPEDPRDWPHAMSAGTQRPTSPVRSTVIA